MPVPLVILEISVLLCGLIAWAWMAKRMRRHQPLLPYEPRRPVPWGGVDLLLALAALILLQGICLGIGVKWSGIQLPDNWIDLDAEGRFVLLASNLVANVLTLVAAVGILRVQSGAGPLDLGFDWRQLPSDLRLGAIAFAAAAPVVFALQWLVSLVIPYQHKLIDAVQDKNDTALSIVAGLAAIVVAPLFEEFFFRVLLQGWLEKKEMALVAPGSELEGDFIQAAGGEQSGTVANMGLFGLTPGLLPMVISSAIFSVMHWGQGGAPVPLFVFALVLGFLYQRTHRILPSLTMHVLLNSVSLGLLFTGSGG